MCDNASVIDVLLGGALGISVGIGVLVSLHYLANWLVRRNHR